jgi:hypothetical protein
MFHAQARIRVFKIKFDFSSPKTCLLGGVAKDWFIKSEVSLYGNSMETISRCLKYMRSLILQLSLAQIHGKHEKVWILRVQLLALLYNSLH